MSGTDRHQGGAAPTSGASRLTTWHQDLFTAMARWRWLQALDGSVAGVLQPLYDRHRSNIAVELMHGGRWAGHSVHTALSDLPIGFWSGALVLDLLGKDVPAGDERMDPAATLSAAGLAAAVGTVATGVTDWTVSDGEDRRVGLFHGLLNTAGVALQAASLAARLTGHRRPARALGVTSMAATAAAGFVGGHLVQGRAVMVNRVAATTGPSRWVRTVAEAELPDGGTIGVEVEGRKVLLHRADGDGVRPGRPLQPRGRPAQPRARSTGAWSPARCTSPASICGTGASSAGPAHHPQPVLPARIRNGWIEVRGSQPRPRTARTRGEAHGVGSGS